MSHKGTVVHVTAGQLPPEDFLEVLLSENKSGMGAVPVIKDGLEISQGQGACKVPDLMGLLDGNKEHEQIVFAASFPDKYTEDDLQPFVLLMDEKDRSKALLLGFLEGDYTVANVPKNADRSAEHFVVENFLKPTIDNLNMAADGDVGALMKMLDGSKVRAKMEAMFATHGSCFLVGSNGQIVTYKKVDGRQGTFPWGWVSNTHGYAPPKAAEPESKGGGIFKKKLISSTAAPPTPAPGGTPQPPPAATPSTEPPAPAPEGDVDTSKFPEGVFYNQKTKQIMAKCPDSIKGKDARRDWYIKYAGAAPSTYKTIPGPVVEVPRSVKSFTEMAERLGATPTPGKDLEPKHIQPASKSERLPIIPADMRESFLKWQSSKEIQELVKIPAPSSPAGFQSNEDKYESWGDLTALELCEHAGWPYEWFVQLAEKYPALTAILLRDLTVEVLKLRGSVKTEPEPTPAPAPDSKPASAGIFSKRKVA